MNRRALLVAVASLALLAAVPASGDAQSGGASFPTVFLTGQTSAGQFSGVFDVSRFGVRGAGLAVFGRLRGTLRDRRLPSTQRIRGAAFSFDVAVAPVAGAASCARLAIGFAGRSAPLVGLPATFAPRRLVLRPRHRTGPSTGELLCGTAAAVAANAPPAVTVHLLNALRLQFA